MFNKLSTLLLLVPAISALQLNQPTTEVHTQSPVTVSWTTSSGDPATFDLYLTNANFHNTFALKNVVTTSDGNITVVIPVVDPGPGYTFQASPVGDVTTTLSATGSFDIGEPLSSTLSSSSSLSGNGTSSSTRPSSLTSSGTGSTRTPSPSSTGSSPSVTPTSAFNGGNNSGSNGALSVTGIGATFVGALVAAGAFLGF